MAKYYTSNTLIESVKRKAAVPENQSTFQEADFLAFANEEMDIGIIPHVLSFHEEYFVYTELVPLVANVNRYEIPTRAVGNKLRDLSYQDSGGNIYEMSRIKIDDLPSFQYGYSQNTYNIFYVEGTDIVLPGNIGAGPTGFLRFSYYLRPNELVNEERVAIVTNINFTTGEVAVSEIPTVINVGEVLDLIQTKSPHKTLALDISAVSINTTTKVITFDPASLPTKLAVGDQVALAGETIVPQIPSDLHSMLAQRVTTRCLEALGDIQGLGSANAKLAEMEQKTGAIISDRVQGAPIKITNRYSSLRTRSYWRR